MHAYVCPAHLIRQLRLVRSAENLPASPMRPKISEKGIPRDGFSSDRHLADKLNPATLQVERRRHLRQIEGQEGGVGGELAGADQGVEAIDGGMEFGAGEDVWPVDVPRQ